MSARRFVTDEMVASYARDGFVLIPGLLADRVDELARDVEANIAAPSVVCVRMICDSSGVCGPGLLRMASGMPILPMSCRGAANLIRLAWASVNVTAASVLALLPMPNAIRR